MTALPVHMVAAHHLPEKRPRLVSGRRFGCGRCVCCSPHATHEHSMSTRSTEFQDWWPSYETPTVYFLLRRRQLNINIKQEQACRPSGVWRGPEDIIATGPSQLLSRRRLDTLSLNVPASHTNIDQADTTVQFIRTMCVGLTAAPKPRAPAAQPAAACSPLPRQPSKAVAAALWDSAHSSGHIIAPSSLAPTPLSAASWLTQATPLRGEPSRHCSPMSVCSEPPSLSAKQLSAMPTSCPSSSSSAASSCAASPSVIAVIDLRRSSSSRQQNRSWTMAKQTSAFCGVPTPVDLEAGLLRAEQGACLPQATAAQASCTSRWDGFIRSLFVNAF